MRGVKQTFTKKKKKHVVGAQGKRPAIGERKAQRKRVVLSNTNALEVKEIQDLQPDMIVDDRIRGSVVGIPGEIVDRLRAVEAFKPAQGWSLFRRPAMLTRRETIDLGREIESISKGGVNDTIRRVYVGERSSGKTVMLLQAMAMAMLKGWVVINIPDGTFILFFHSTYHLWNFS